MSLKKGHSKLDGRADVNSNIVCNSHSFGEQAQPIENSNAGCSDDRPARGRVAFATVKVLLTGAQRNPCPWDLKGKMEPTWLNETT